MTVITLTAEQADLIQVVLDRAEMDHREAADCATFTRAALIVRAHRLNANLPDEAQIPVPSATTTAGLPYCSTPTRTGQGCGHKRNTAGRCPVHGWSPGRPASTPLTTTKG